MPALDRLIINENCDAENLHESMRTLQTERFYCTLLTTLCSIERNKKLKKKSVLDHFYFFARAKMIVALWVQAQKYPSSVNFIPN